MQREHMHRSITYEGTTVTLMVCVLLLAMTLLIVSGILVTQAETFMG